MKAEFRGAPKRGQPTNSKADPVKSTLTKKTDRDAERKRNSRRANEGESRYLNGVSAMNYVTAAANRIMVTPSIVLRNKIRRQGHQNGFVWTSFFNRSGSVSGGFD